MKIWNLEKEIDALTAFIIGRREKRKQDIRSAVESIKEELLAKGGKALIEFSRRWDGWREDHPLRLTENEIHEGASKIEKKELTALKEMIKNVASYHRQQKGHNRTYRRKGVVVREEFVPVERALVYVPGGKASYPSSLIMGVVPAQLAGVKNILVTTPAVNGVVNPYVAACCALLGVRDVYRIGGAQAIYAFSYGIGSIPRVDMIV
jgi:histidinol dehydrogenase